MSRITELLRRMTGQPPRIVTQLAGLEEVVNESRGRVDPNVIAEADSLIRRAGARLTLSAEHTVVALAGATGSGKSSLFNALSGLEVAAVGVKRPTTSWALSCVWGQDGAEDLLDWLEIPKRHQVNRLSLLDESAADRDLHGLVLLDLPDHDSTEVSHHLEVHRLVELADLLVWVLDPQKYADAAVHDHFLRPMHDHADSMLVLLNHCDEISPEAVDRCVADINRLLRLDGLASVPVLATSATRGDGLPTMRSMLARRVAAKDVARDRLTADIRVLAAKFADEVGDADPPDPATVGRAELLDACADAAGVAVVVDAAENAARQRSSSATGWPITNWLSVLRPDPIRRLHLEGLPDAARGATSRGTSMRRRPHTALPEPTPVQRARVDAAVRNIVDQTTRGMGRGWEDSVRAASVSRLDDLSDELDSAIARTDLGLSRPPMWWRFTHLLQWLLFAAVVGGGVWLIGIAAAQFLQISKPQAPKLGSIPIPTLLFVGGIVFGLLLALVGRALGRRSARHMAQRAERRLRSALENATDDLAIKPMTVEVDSYRRARDGLAKALG
jgi:GTP-binding protein EngB required for normal cell division